MPRFEVTERRKAQKEQQRRWDLPAGSRLWAYVRHSPGEKQTIDSQIAGLRDWFTENGWVLERTFADEALEGSREDRAQFQEMIALARQGARQVDGIALWSFARFARDQLDAQFYKAELRKLGYVLISKVDDVPNNEMAPIYEAFIDWKNQRFLEDLSSDVKRGLSFVVDQGYWPGGTVPVGYRVEKVEIGKRHNGEARMGNHLVKDEDLAARVLLAWRMKIDDNASYLEIHEATHLYSDSKHYSDFFDNLLYAGIFKYHGIRYPATWEDGGRFCEAYISLEEYLQVQANRQKRTRQVTHPRSLSSGYLLTGLLYCGVCSEHGKPTTLVGQTDTRRPDTRVYRCSTKIRDRGTACSLPRIPCWRLDGAVVDMLRQHVLTAEYVRSEVERANAILEQSTTTVDSQLEEASRLAKLQQKKVENIVDLIGKRGVTDILQAQYDAANRAWLEATSRMNSLKSQSLQNRVRRISMADAQRVLDEMGKTLTDGTLTEQQELVRRFIDRIDVYPDRIDVHFKFRMEAFSQAISGLTIEEPAPKEEGSDVRSLRQVYGRCPHGGSNAGLWLRRPSLCPLSYRGKNNL